LASTGLFAADLAVFGRDRGAVMPWVGLFAFRGMDISTRGSDAMNLLLIHRDPRISQILQRGAQVRAIDQVTAVDSIEAGVRQAREKIDVIIFDVTLDRFEGVRVERALRRANPTALLVAVGPSVPGSAAFRMAAVGVAAFLDMPVDEERVSACLRSLAEPSDLLIRAARVEVGARGLKQAQRVVRLSMCQEALDRAGGSRRAAARLLGVDRRAVQKIAVELAKRGRSHDAPVLDVPVPHVPVPHVPVPARVPANVEAAEVKSAG
jgi:DNA-binding NtrC family response regulator